MIRILFLLLYSLYAITPVNLYVVADSDGSRGDVQSCRHAISDIIWANGLFSLFRDDDELPSAVVQISGNARAESDAVLVKKRRAVCREQFSVKPLFDMRLLPSEYLEQPWACALEFDVAKNPLLQKSDSSFVLITDLSPPIFLS